MKTNMDLDTEDGMANAVAWTQHTIAHVRDGGVWAIPRSGMLVRINHTNKTAIITEGFLPDTAIPRVFKAMGWTVTEEVVQ